MPNTMTKKVDLLEVQPSGKLIFTGPFDKAGKTDLVLKNLTYKQLIYKVKTTEPKRYCVRPNCGVIAAQQVITVSVILQPGGDALYDEQGLHKFQVLHMVKPEDDDSPVEQLWRKVNPAMIFDHKLKCYFETPEEFGRRTEVKSGSPPITVQELKGRLEQMKQNNTKLQMDLAEARKRVDLARAPASQMPNTLFFAMFAILGWLFGKFVI